NNIGIKSQKLCKQKIITGIKCSTKFRAMKRTYKVILDHNKKSENNRKEWEYFEIMQELFSDKPWIKPLSLAGSHLQLDEEEKENISQEKISDTFSSRTKRKKNFNMEEYVLQSKEKWKKKREIRSKEHEEKMLSFKRIENLMERLLEKEN
ncbi:uncharacterized protein LOC105840960, partial [Monomorium pharaonis]|uniref:uncharacterized protein LOC105840960 n=1 Tax=Monomorium pharaonis TaxID=307658 RepID=UPI0017461966